MGLARVGSGECETAIVLAYEGLSAVKLEERGNGWDTPRQSRDQCNPVWWDVHDEFTRFMRDT